MKLRVPGLGGEYRGSHPTRGAWIEISSHSAASAAWESHPTRGAWIEIRAGCGPRWRRPGRTPHGVRGLKFPIGGRVRRVARRTPHGVRGLKYRSSGSIYAPSLSHPTRGAWIEIRREGHRDKQSKSHPTRGAWIEIARGTDAQLPQPGRTPHGVRGLK